MNKKAHLNQWDILIVIIIISILFFAFLTIRNFEESNNAWDNFHKKQDCISKYGDDINFCISQGNNRRMELVIFCYKQEQVLNTTCIELREKIGDCMSLVISDYNNCVGNI